MGVVQKRPGSRDVVGLPGTKWVFLDVNNNEGSALRLVAIYALARVENQISPGIWKHLLGRLKVIQ